MKLPDTMVPGVIMKAPGESFVSSVIDAVQRMFGNTPSF